MAHLIQRVTTTGKLYYAGQVDTGGKAVWVGQYWGISKASYSTQGQLPPPATVTTTSVQYIRQTDEVWVADVEAPAGGVTELNEGRV